MIDELIQDFNNFNPESFNQKLSIFRFNWIKRIIVKLVLKRIYDTYECNTMYNDYERVRKALILRMQLNYDEIK